MEGKQLYFYGVMLRGTAPAAMAGAGIGGSDVEPVACGDLDALTSWVSPEALHMDVDDTLVHEQVLSNALKVGTVIPAAFGHLFSGEAELCDLLRESAGELKANLAYLTGRVEMGLKAMWTKEAFLADIETPELQDLANQARVPGADQSVAVAVGQLVEELVTRRRQHYTTEICGKLESHAVSMKLNDPLTVRMAFNAAFLVEGREQIAFRRAVEEAVRPYRNKLEFSMTGPWPAHNFVAIRL
jgi:hypothetical protein